MRPAMTDRTRQMFRWVLTGLGLAAAALGAFYLTVRGRGYG